MVNAQMVNRFEYSHLKEMEKHFFKMFSEWHKLKRMKMKLTRPEFADMMYMSHHTVMNYEYGKRVPRDIDAYMKEVEELAKDCKVKEDKPKQTRVRPTYKVAMIDPETGKTLRIFGDTLTAAAHVNKSKSAIQKACAGSHKISGGYKWEYITK
jgi:DNA-binding transcriptional regulator YiaG